MIRRASQWWQNERITAHLVQRLGTYYRQDTQKNINTPYKELQSPPCGFSPKYFMFNISSRLFYMLHLTQITLCTVKGKVTVRHHKKDVTVIKVSSGALPYCIQSHVGIMVPHLSHRPISSASLSYSRN